MYIIITKYLTQLICNHLDLTKLEDKKECTKLPYQPYKEHNCNNQNIGYTNRNIRVLERI